MIPQKGHRTVPNGPGQPVPQPMFHCILGADPFAVRQALGDIRSRFQHDVGEEMMGRLELVLAEVLNNVTEHGEGEGRVDAIARTSIHLCIVRHETGLSCAITDNGASLPAECLLPRHLPYPTDEGLPEGGFGWYMIQDLTQALCYYREERRNYLAFVIPFSTASA